MKKLKIKIKGFLLQKYNYMLKIINYPELSNIYTNKKKSIKIKTSKHFPSSTREWKNSIYAFNKNNLNLIPTTELSTMSIIKSYFSMFNENIEKKLRTKRLSLRFRRLSSNKIYISNGEFKHTNNKVVINLYLFNRQKINYSIITNDYEKNKSFLPTKVDYKKLKALKKKNLLKVLRIKSLLILKKLNKEKYVLIKKMQKNKINQTISNYIDIYTKDFYNKFKKESLNKLQLYIYYKQLKYVNESKYKYTYLQYLKEQLNIIYNKDIEFNLIDLKRFYLNSDIMSESITKKITKNRKKIKRFLDKLKNKIKIFNKIKYLHRKVIKNKLYEKEDLTNSTKLLKKNIIKNLKYKKITGFRLEAKGRLTKRYTASRSVSNIRYKGNLLNIDSSIKGLSSVLLKGNLKSNVQYTKLASKTRIGSFGIKGWVSGY